MRSLIDPDDRGRTGCPGAVYRSGTRSGALAATASIVLAMAVGPASAFVPEEAHAGRAQRVVGVTVTDPAGLARTIDAIRHVGPRVTARLVLDPGPLERYVGTVRRLAGAGAVMTQPVDSSGMSGLGLRGYRTRFRSALRLLGRRTAVWEVGNEVNGAWTGRPRLVGKKIVAAHRQVRARGGRTALTLYYNRGCRSDRHELGPLAWSRRFLPAGVRARLDYLYLSYYETECNGRRPATAEWRRYFRRLHGLFPGARLGFGEVGLPEPTTAATETRARSIIRRYYRLDPGLPYFVGGGFYWYFVQDMTPWRSSTLFRELCRSVSSGGHRD